MEKYLKNLQKNLSQVLEIWYVVWPSGPIQSAPKKPCYGGPGFEPKKYIETIQKKKSSLELLGLVT